MDFLQILSIIVPATLVYAAPLILTALGGVFSERSGVVNIGLEGLMIIGAFTNVMFNLFFGRELGAAAPWLALAAAMIAGGLFSLIHAAAAVSFRADQTVTGVAINMLALGATLFIVKLIYGKAQTDKIPEPFYKTNIPGLSDIPVLGKIFFSDVYYTSILAIVLAFVSWFILFKTPFGLRIRSVGEHPMAADTMGINVFGMRYIGVMISGLFGGLGGGVYASTIALDFTHSTISGQGFIALAALVFGKWHPIGALGAALFFGFAQSLSIIGSLLPLFKDIPNVYMLMAPYILTILALAGFIGRADAPKANGIPYIKGKR
ncbi:guanosine ABC transporter permease NupQ [Bacillus sp. L381]|uniref:ABC transporter permease n=1 Tax=Bacillus TaxID=1386 RepID=UPI001BA7962D|nr:MULTISPECIES: ABC transporter permease [Bacillus]MCR9040746.1 guanosine ABC transporter permease NupQ [Bacillus velezensis]QUN08829.1 guanosine ABC transporter permease NupQ [Bacillus amyloliquefaciens]QYM81903.1 guanosine ABC transporter permease NupQ [Bacillus sp. 7D3]QZY11049.1 guanosine ABC transporter permease NupQ [Bacillus amyloliquefaciens]WIX20951.1 guanosine ABC transporter permease NupQ [Bacillus sp. L381]